MREEIMHCCGNCRHHKYEKIDEGFICINEDSEYCADWTEWNDCCECFEPRNRED